MPPFSLRALQQEIARLTTELGDHAETLTRAAGDLILREDPYHVVAYRGFGNGKKVLLHGRALEDEGLTPADAGDPAWRNVLNALKRLETDPLPRARLRVRTAGIERELIANPEGFFHEWLTLAKPLPADASWHPATVELLSPVRTGAEPVVAIAQILVPPPSATFGVISDIDDTVLQSKVSSFLDAARTMLVGNARTRLPFPGVAAFYDALHRGSASDANPIFYVSSSPWNLYDLITDFLEIQKIPAGPVLLRDWDLEPGALASKRHHSHKLALIREIMDLYPSLPFILIGDTTQKDPEIYRHVVGEYPDRILAVYIRNVSAHPERSAAVRKLADEILAARSTLILADDTMAAARHAAEHNWISPSALSSISDEKRADEGKTDEKVAPTAAPAKPKEAPTVVVSDDPKAEVAKE